MTTALLALIGGIAAVKLFGKKKSVSGVSGVLWDYAIREVEDAGFDLDKDYYVAVGWNGSDLTRIRKKFGYRQSTSSKAMGRSENYSFWLALQHHKEKLGL